MNDLFEICEKIINLDYYTMIDDYFEENKEFILNLNKQQLYDEGIKSNGKKVGEYTEYTKIIKRRKRQRIDHMTLKDTGEFYDSFTLNFDGVNLVFDADGLKIKDELDDKPTDLLVDYGIDVLGLTDENMVYIANDLRNYIITRIDEAITL